MSESNQLCLDDSDLLILQNATSINPPSVVVIVIPVNVAFIIRNAAYWKTMQCLGPSQPSTCHTTLGKQVGSELAGDDSLFVRGGDSF